MKKTFKKLILLIAVIMTAMLCLAFSASAETWGDYEYYSDYATGNITLTKYNGKATSVTIPSKINGKPVVEINGAFYENEKIKSVKIPNSVKTIGAGAFSFCDSLTSVTIPNSVTTIGGCAFSGCYSLERITIPNSVTIIDYDAFKNCDSLTSVKIPNSVKTIGDSAFRYCSALSEVTLGNNVKKIGGSAFSSCNELEEITIPASVKSIGTDAFLGVESGMDLTVLLCPKGSYASKWAKKAGQPYVITNPSGNENIVKGRVGKFNWSVNKLTGELKLSGSGKMNYFTNTFAPWYEYRYYIKSISFPKGLAEIGQNSFKRLYRVRSIKIPGSVKVIGDSAFAYCDNLKSVVLNKGVTSVGSSAFADCMSLEKVSVSDGLRSINSYAFSGCISLASITIPEGVTNIGGGAFGSCKALKAITIPKSVTTIGSGAFVNCDSLVSVTIPGSVTSLSVYVFNGCDSLSTLEIYADIGYIEMGALDGCKNLKKVVLGKNIEEIYSHAFAEYKDYLEVVIENENCVINPDCGLNYNHTIWGYKGSTAEAFADEIGARFIDINHKHVYKNKTTKATLTKNGKLESVCKVCGKVSKTTAIYYPKSIKLSATSFTYNGKAISPAVTVKDSKGNVLKKGTDYTVVYSSGRTNPGSYVAKVTFKGKYSGVQRITFTIKPSAPAITAVASTAKGRVTVAWKNVVGETGYQVYYSTKKDSGYKAFMTSKADVVKVAKNGLASGKTYYFKVRAYKTVSGTNIYSAWSSAKAVKIK